MAEEPSANHPCGETSDQASEVDNVEVPDQKLDYTRRLNDFDINDLDVICTSSRDESNKMIDRIRKRVGGLYPRYIDACVKYMREDEPPPKGQCTVVKEDELYSFVSFNVAGDKQKEHESGLEINANKYIDIQCKCRFPFMGGKRLHSLADVAGSVIQPFYKNMKEKTDREEDHKLWRISPLSDHLIEYAMTGAYATYESWNKIENIREGLGYAKAK
ncbi:hypothetical protein ZWY2020_004702 [Hordeum vulgare]|nr:hypothetical protein ZWY2020_004702 [Hordeum vulgare]